MVGDGAPSPQPLDAAEEQYVRAKTSVWWDIENCIVQNTCDPYAIAQNISSALVRLNYWGPVSIIAYGDTSKISPYIQQALNSTGIALNHVPAGVKDASDKKILVEMLFWAVDNPAPANYLLISGDRDFSNALHQLRMRRYNILIAQPYNISTPLRAAAKSVWLWTSLLVGGPPLTSANSSQLINNGYTYISGSASFPTGSVQATQPADYFCGSLHLENPKPANMGKKTNQKHKRKRSRLNWRFASGGRSTMMHQEAQQNDIERGVWAAISLGDKGHAIAQQLINDIPMCGTCGRNHFGVCRMGHRFCFKCGEEGHFVPNCPKVQHEQVIMPGHVLPKTPVNDEADSIVVTGTIPRVFKKQPTFCRQPLVKRSTQDKCGLSVHTHKVLVKRRCYKSKMKGHVTNNNCPKDEIMSRHLLTAASPGDEVQVAVVTGVGNEDPSQSTSGYWGDA